MRIVVFVGSPVEDDEKEVRYIYQIYDIFYEIYWIYMRKRRHIH